MVLGARGTLVLPDLIFEDSKVDIVFITSARDSNRVTKIVNGFRWIASSPNAVDGGKSLGNPIPRDMMLEDKFMEFSFGHYSVCHIETGVLPFCRSVNIQFFRVSVDGSCKIRTREQRE